MSIFIDLYVYSFTRVIGVNLILILIIILMNKIFLPNKYYIFYWINIIFFFTLIYSSFFIYYSSKNFFEKISIFISFFIIYILLFVLDIKNKYKVWHYGLLYYFYFVSIIFILSADIITTFICYEMLMIPSFLLLLEGTYSKKSFFAILYFFLWTQGGSLLIFIGLIILIKIIHFKIFLVNLFYLYNQSIWINNLIYYCIFLGIGIKIPIFPFYKWLIQIHVEASSGFSMFLSGYLVKIALILLYKINLILPAVNTYIINILIILGIINASFKFINQIDIKKIVAYATIQEMNMILLILINGDKSLEYYLWMFIFGHCTLSILMFYTVEMIYKRFNSRNILHIGKIYLIYPNLSKIIFIKIFIFLGFPGTIKFFLELYFFIFIFSINYFLGIILILTVVLVGGISYLKKWLIILYNTKSKELFNSDLSMPELILSSWLVTNNTVISLLILLY